MKRPLQLGGLTGVLSPKQDLAVRLIAAALLTTVGALFLTDLIDLEEAGFGAAAVLLGLIIVAVPLSRLRDMQKVKAFGVELELAERAMEEAPTAELNEEGEKENYNQISDLQLRLEAKVAYVAKHIVGFEPVGRWSSYLNVGSLEYDGYLSKEDAIAARRLLGLRPSDIRSASAKEKQAYLERAQPFVRGIRATIFHRVVQRTLDKQFKAKTRQCAREPGKRPDLQIQRGEAAGALVFPAFSGGGGYWNSKRVRRRAKELAELSEQALIVVPPNSRIKDPKVKGVRLIALDRLVRLPRIGDAW